MIKTILPLFFLLLMASCGGEVVDNKSDDKTEREVSAIYVDTMHLSRQTFNKQIVCNGKLRAVQKSEITFPRAGIITAIHAANGRNVERGALLAMVDTESAEIQLHKARRAMEKADMDLMDEVIGRGYSVDDTTVVPEKIMYYAKHSSGYNTAQDNLAAAERAYEDCFVRAPFAGRVANMDAKVYDKSGAVLCMLIDDSSFDVEFNVLEAELTEIATGQRVVVTPFVNDENTFEGVITEINPLIDNKGQIKVRAKVRNRDGYLIEGMNVRLVMNREVKNQFIVPRNAVVLRDGFHVVFRYEGGEAVWTYVDVVASNIDSHLITGHAEKETTISEEDAIIVSGNRNLADGVKVNIK